MKLAIISVTTPGKKLAKNLKEILNEDPSFIEIKLFHQNVKETLKHIFPNYDTILGIMASGIMIRGVCGLLESKTSDPAVLVMDESANHILSLISGHLGGANQVALKIAAHIGADPVLTTATDVHGRLGIDELARKYYWQIENPEKILYFNRAILKGDKVELITNLDIEYIFDDPRSINNYYKTIIPDFNGLNDILNKNSHDNLSKTSFFNNKSINGENSKILAVLNDEILIISPKKLVVGIGSRKGVSKDQVINALKNSLKFLELPLDRINIMATGEIKSNEKGILDCANYLDVILDIVSLNDIKNFESSQCTPSDFVNQNFGVGGICEPCALLTAGQDSKLILKKTAYNGVTVAIAIR